MPSAHGAIQSFLLMKRSSGYLAKSRMSSGFQSLFFAHRIQPTWLHQKPLRGEWRSSSVSL